MRLKQACSLYGDYGLNISAEAYVDDGVVLIRTTDFDDNGDLSLADARRVSLHDAREKLLRRGDVLFSRAGTIGRSMVFNADVDATFAAYLVRFRPRPSVLSTKFVHYWARSEQFWQQVRGGTIESTIGNFNAAKLRNLTLPAVDFPTQMAVAAFLDDETARIDALIEKKRSFLLAVEAEFDAFVSVAVIKGLDRTAQTKASANEWEPRLPAHWIKTRLKFLCQNVSDCLHETPTHLDDGEYPSVRTADVRRGAVDLVNAKRVSEAEYRHRVQRLEPRAGDILYSREGERYGIAAVVPEGSKLCLGQRMMLFRVNQRVLPAYLMWSMNGQFAYSFLKRTTFGSTSPHLNIFDIKNTPIFLPPTGEQAQIADAITSRFTKKEALASRLSLSVEKLREFRAAVITAAVTGEIDLAKWRRRGESDRRLERIEAEMTA